MSFSYEKPTTDLKRVRLLVGDTNDARVLLEDAEIQFFLDEEGGIYAAAAAAADALAAKFAGDIAVNRASGSLSKDQRFDHYQKLARALRLKGFGKAESFAGGRLISEKERQETTRDRVQPRFRRDQDTIDRTQGEFDEDI